MAAFVDEEGTTSPSICASAAFVNEEGMTN